MLNNFLNKNLKLIQHSHSYSHTHSHTHSYLQLCNTNMILKPDKPDIILLSSIILETCSTICMKKTLNNKKWFFPVYIGYALSFYMFPKSLNKYSLSTAYMIWCGIGIILTNIMDNIIYKEIITLKKIFGSLIIIIGMKLTK